MTRRTTPRALAILLLAAPGAARAQIDSALLSKVVFNLESPGGKSLAMGGAFTAIADDATAGLANPAGLGLLSTVEAGISAKRSDDVVGLVTARSTATGSGFLTPYPPVRGVNSDIESAASGVEFAGVVVPVSRRFVLGLTYAENLRFEGDPGEEGYQYVELRDNRSGSVGTRRDFLFEYREYGPVSLTNRVLALSAAWRVTDRVRVGAGVTWNRTRFELGGDAAGPHRIVNLTYLTPTNVDVRTLTLSVEDFAGQSWGGVLGVHADLVEGGAVSVGAVFRSASRAEGTLVLGGDVPSSLQGQERRRFTFSVPRDAALGLAVRPVPGLTVSAEGQWVDYGGVFGEELPVSSFDGLAGPPPGVPVESVLPDLSRAEDAFVPRIGLEYVATAGSTLLAFRLGYHREPAHGVTADLYVTDVSGTRYDVDDPPYSQAVRTVYDGGRADDRFSGGIGATVFRNLSFDLAFDVGRSGRVVAGSLFYRF